MNQMMKGNNQVSNLHQNWVKDPGGVKKADVRLQENFSSLENSFMTFKSRPGVSYSLRVNIRLDNKNDQLTLINNH
jgi:hypothetical protein